MVPEDLDFSDPDVARAYLDHPVTEQLAEDHGRAFRALPAAQQQAELSEYISGLEEKRTEVAAAVERLGPDAPALPVLRQVLDALDKNLEASTWRILKLDEG